MTNMKGKFGGKMDSNFFAQFNDRKGLLSL